MQPIQIGKVMGPDTSYPEPGPLDQKPEQNQAKPDASSTEPAKSESEEYDWEAYDRLAKHTLQ